MNFLREIYGKVKAVLSTAVRAVGVGDLTALALLFVVAGVMLAMGNYILSSIGNQLPANSTAVSAIGNATSGINTFASWLPILAVVIISAIVIGILISAFMGRKE